MIEISNEEITNKMFFIREENSNQPIAVVKVGDLMKFKRPQGEWIKDNSGDRFCSVCGKSALYHEIGLIIESRFCPNCGADMYGGGIMKNTIAQ